MNGFQRFVRALLAVGKVALERDDLGIGPRHCLGHVGRDPARNALRGRRRFLARLAHMQRELLDAAFDRAEIAELLVGRLDLVGDADDLPLQMFECRLVARKPVGVVQLVGQRPDQRFQIARQRPDLLHAGVERLGEIIDALRERVEAGRAGALRDVVDARAQRLHVAGKRRDAFGRRDTRRELAQLVDRRFEIAQRFGIGRTDREAVHLVRQFRHARVETRQAFGRRHRVQALVDFGEVALDGFQRRRVGATPVAVVDPLGERLHVALQAFQRAARQGFVDGTRDLGKVRAQCGDRILDIGRVPQGFDLLGDVVKLALQTGEIRVRCRCAAGAAVQRVLARGDLGDRLVDFKIGGLRRDRRRGVGRGTVRGGGRWASGGQLFEARIEPGDGVLETRAAHRRSGGCKLLTGAGEALRQLSESRAERAGLTLRLCGAGGRRIAERRFQPFVDRHPGTIGGFARRLVQFRAQTTFIPRCAWRHCLTRSLWSEEQGVALRQNGRSLTGNGRRARFCVLRRDFSALR